MAQQNGMDEMLSPAEWAQLLSKEFGKISANGSKIHKYGDLVVQYNGNRVHKIGQHVVARRDINSKPTVVKIGGMQLEYRGRKLYFNGKNSGFETAAKAAKPSTTKASSAPSSSSTSSSSVRSSLPKGARFGGSTAYKSPTIAYSAVEPKFCENLSGMEPGGFYFSPSGKILKYFPMSRQYRILLQFQNERALGEDFSSSVCGFDIRNLQRDGAADIHSELMTSNKRGLHLQHDPDDPSVQWGQITKFIQQSDYLTYGNRPVKFEFNAKGPDGSLSHHVVNANWFAPALPSCTEQNVDEIFDHLFSKGHPGEKFPARLQFYKIKLFSTYFHKLSDEERNARLTYLKTKRDRLKFEKEDAPASTGDTRLDMRAEVRKLREQWKAEGKSDDEIAELSKDKMREIQRRQRQMQRQGELPGRSAPGERSADMADLAALKRQWRDEGKSRDEIRELVRAKLKESKGVEMERRKAERQKQREKEKEIHKIEYAQKKADVANKKEAADQGFWASSLLESPKTPFVYAGQMVTLKIRQNINEIPNFPTQMVHGFLPGDRDLAQSKTCGTVSAGACQVPIPRIAEGQQLELCIGGFNVQKAGWDWGEPLTVTICKDQAEAEQKGGYDAAQQKAEASPKKKPNEGEFQHSKAYHDANKLAARRLQHLRNFEKKWLKDKKWQSVGSGWIDNPYLEEQYEYIPSVEKMKKEHRLGWDMKHLTWVTTDQQIEEFVDSQFRAEETEEYFFFSPFPEYITYEQGGTYTRNGFQWLHYLLDLMSASAQCERIFEERNDDSNKEAASQVWASLRSHRERLNQNCTLRRGNPQIYSVLEATTKSLMEEAGLKFERTRSGLEVVPIGGETGGSSSMNSTLGEDPEHTTATTLKEHAKIAIDDIMIQVTQEQKAKRKIEKAKNSKTVLLVNGARNLAAADRNGLSDPFCVIVQSGNADRKTKVIKKTLDPNWEQRFPIRGDKDVTILVFDKDPIGKDFLGAAILKSPFDSCSKKEFTLGNLAGQKLKKGIKISGQIIVSILKE